MSSPAPGLVRVVRHFTSTAYVVAEDRTLLLWHPRLRMWLDMGTKESYWAIEQARALRGLLLARGWQLNVDLKYHEARSGRHDEKAWSRRVAPMLKFLFPNKDKWDAVTKPPRPRSPRRS